MMGIHNSRIPCDDRHLGTKREAQVNKETIFEGTSQTA